MHDFLSNIATLLLSIKQRALEKWMIISFFFLLISCGGPSDKSKFLASSGGKPDEILWVMNEKLWEDTIGTTINNRFQRSYEVLPQAEPAYFIRKKTFQEFNNDIIKKYRVIVICTSKEADIEYGSVRDIIITNGIEFQKTLILNNVWAKPQLVVIVTADNNEELLQLMQNEGGKIEAAIRETENKAIDKYLYGNTPNQEAIDLVYKNFNYKFNIPLDYFVGINEEHFMWLRKETVPLSSNILLYQKELLPEEIAGGVDWPQYAKNIRAYLGKTYISSRVENSYMTVEERFAPTIQDTIQILGYPAIRTRGLWRIENDFMGGPYENIAWFNPKTNTYNMIDLYVHAPKEGKKRYMRHLIRMLETIEE